MRCGLYGKLPAKRDFIAVAAPREFLSVWEPWLQGGVAASRQALGQGWQEHYLRAPIWRFWLGPDLCGGGAVLGALMPSVDGVGRYFPLTIFCRAEPGENLAPPALDAHESWLGAAEDVLLTALGEGATYEAVQEGLVGLTPPAPSVSDEGPPGLVRARDGTLVLPAEGAQIPDVLSGLGRLEGARAHAGASFWWTAGGEDFAPLVAAARRMPDPYLFTGMLTGRFDGAVS